VQQSSLTVHTPYKSEQPLAAPAVSSQRPTVLQRSEQQSVSTVHVVPVAAHTVDGAPDSAPASEGSTLTHWLFWQMLPGAQSLSTWHAAPAEWQPNCGGTMVAAKTRATSNVVVQAPSV
jgi:hypothetical protein